MRSSFYDICTEFFKDKTEISAAAFYRELFPVGELQSREESNNFKYNAIFVETVNTANGIRGRRFTVGNDLEHLDELLKSENFVITAPMSYVGRNRTAKNARMLYALAFDIDGIKGEKGLINLFFQISNDILPSPTYVVNSGSGLHFYYFLEEPVPMFPSVTEPLEKLKFALTRKIWNSYVTRLSEENQIQYEPIWQPFRIVGGVTKDFKKTGHRVRCWSYGKPTSLEYLNKFVEENDRIPKNAIQYKSKMKLEEAKEKFPDWYERRIVKGEGRKHWKIKPDLYNWWLNQIKNKTVVGHRYYCIMCLAIYAIKCGVEFERLEKDANSLLEDFKNLTPDPDNIFLQSDIDEALQAYKDEFATMPINSIVHFSGIAIQKNKRNGRKQAEHLKRARAVQNVDYPNGEWRCKKSKQKIVFDFMLDYAKREYKIPKKSEVIKSTGLSKPTVYKHYADFFETDEWANLNHDSCEGSWLFERMMKNEAKNFQPI